MLTLQSLNHLSEEPGVYLFRDERQHILYIGKAKNIKKRVSQYFAAGSVRKQDMMQKASHVEFMICQSEQEALILESNLIKQHKPAFNRLLKGDNGYVYVKITNHPWPQIILTRFRSNDGATYIGPKNNTMHLRKLIQRMRQYLQFRGCKDTQFKEGVLCNDFIFGLCKGRCVYAKLGQKNEAHYLEQAKRLGFSLEKTE